MISIFLKVNIHYLLHFQIDLFLFIYFVVTIFPITQTKQKQKN